jgi:hypothetical protein
LQLYLLTPTIRNADYADQGGFSPIKIKNGPTGLRPPPQIAPIAGDLGRKRNTVSWYLAIIAQMFFNVLIDFDKLQNRGFDMRAPLFGCIIVTRKENEQSIDIDTQVITLSMVRTRLGTMGRMFIINGPFKPFMRSLFEWRCQMDLQEIMQ